MDKSLIAFFITLAVVFTICTIVAIVREVKVKKQNNSYIKEAEKEF